MRAAASVVALLACLGGAAACTGNTPFCTDGSAVTLAGMGGASNYPTSNLPCGDLSCRLAGPNDPNSGSCPAGITYTVNADGSITYSGANVSLGRVFAGNALCNGSTLSTCAQGVDKGIKVISHIDICYTIVTPPTPAPMLVIPPTPAPMLVTQPTTPVAPTNGGPDTTGDPWVTGLAGQRFLFNPKVTEEAWFAAVSDAHLQINLKLHKYEGVVEEDPARDFYTGVSIQYFDEDGFATQSLLVEVRDDNNFDFSCKDLSENAPEHCLGGGAVDVMVNGVRMLEGGEVQTGEGFTLAASNVVASCQGISETQLRHQAHLQKNRELSAALSFEDFLVNRSIRSPADCDRWIAAANRNVGGVYKAAGAKSTFRFSTPRTVAVTEFDTHIPNDITTKPKVFRMDFFMTNYKAIEGTQGFIGETGKVRYSSNMQPIMTGKVLKGTDEQYRVDGPMGRDFAAKHL